jgi:hypothetical protein
MYEGTCSVRQQAKQPPAAVGQSESIIGGPPVVVPAVVVPAVVVPAVVVPAVVVPAVVVPAVVVPAVVDDEHHCATCVAASVQLAHDAHWRICPPA